MQDIRKITGRMESVKFKVVDGRIIDEVSKLPNKAFYAYMKTCWSRLQQGSGLDGKSQVQHTKNDDRYSNIRY